MSSGQISRTLSVAGHAGFAASVAFDETGVPVQVSVTITDRTLMREFYQHQQRALNCMERRPAWAMDLSDALEHVK